MYCKNCGTKIEEGENFCGECGAMVNQGTEIFSEINNRQNKVSLKFLDAIKLYFCKFADVKGKATRREYWYIVLLWSATVTLLGLLTLLFINIAPIVGYVCLFIDILWISITSIPSLTLSIKRFNDVGKSWKDLLKFFIVLVVAYILFALLISLSILCGQHSLAIGIGIVGLVFVIGYLIVLLTVLCKKGSKTDSESIVEANRITFSKSFLVEYIKNHKTTMGLLIGIILTDVALYWVFAFDPKFLRISSNIVFSTFLIIEIIEAIMLYVAIIKILSNIGSKYNHCKRIFRLSCMNVALSVISQIILCADSHRGMNIFGFIVLLLASLILCLSSIFENRKNGLSARND